MREKVRHGDARIAERLPHAQPGHSKMRDTVCASKEFIGGITKGDVHTTACHTMSEGRVFIRLPTGSAEETSTGRQILTESHLCAGPRPSPGVREWNRHAPHLLRENPRLVREMHTRHISSLLRPKEEEQQSRSTNTSGIKPQLRGA